MIIVVNFTESINFHDTLPTINPISSGYGEISYGESLFGDILSYGGNLLYPELIPNSAVNVDSPSIISIISIAFTESINFHDTAPTITSISSGYGEMVYGQVNYGEGAISESSIVVTYSDRIRPPAINVITPSIDALNDFILSTWI